MSLSDKLPRGVRRLFRLPPSYARRMRDLDDEIRFHIETHAERLRATGVSESDAMAAALERFGDAADLRKYCGALAAHREPARRIRQWVDELAQDVHYALRQIRRAPVFTATAALILALGIGANTGVFSIVHHSLIAPLPFADGNRMVTFMTLSGGGQIFITPSRELLSAWRDRAHTVEQAFLYRERTFTLGDSTRGPTEQLSGAALPPSAFGFIGVRPMLGRAIVPGDTLASAPPVALLGEGVWRRSFGASRDVIGTRVVLDGTMHTVVGVMPGRFFMPFTDSRDVFVALRHGDPGRPSGLAKLRPGMSVADANRELAALFPAKSALNSYDEPPRVAREVDLVGRTQKQIFLMLFGVVCIVLLIACANVGNLLLARSWTRQREFAVRVALGAGRRRIVRQVLTESLMLALGAGVLGIAVAFLVLHGVRAALPNDSANYIQVRIEGAVLLWSAGLSAVAGLLFGAVPAFTAAGAQAGESLKAGARTAAGSVAARRLRTGLVVTEIALSVVLLAGAGLLVRTLVALRQVDVGLEPHGLVSGSLRWPANAPFDSTTRSAELSAVIAGVRAIPGVRGAMVSGMAPLDYGIGMGAVEVEGRPTAPGDSLQTTGYASVPAEFFTFTGIPLIQGRTFTAAPGPGSRANTWEIIINEKLARRLWPNGGALGARIRRSGGPFQTVVGVVGDVRMPGERARGLNKDLQIYVQHSAATRFADLVVRSDLPMSVLAPAITKALHDASPGLRLTKPTTADAVIARSFTGQRFVLDLLGAFAVLAVILAAVGLHGVIAYDVNQRTREIGVRVALGAQSRDVARLVLGRAVGVAIAGVVIGTVGSLAATRAIQALLFGVGPGDPLTLGVVGITLLAIAVVATYAPARRAARLDPVEALRAD